MKSNILFVSGIPDHDEIQVKKAHPNGDILQFSYDGISDFFLYMNPPDWNKLPVLIDAREFPFQFDPATHCIINEIAEADSHTKTLDYLSRLLKKHPEIPVINPPEQVHMTRRDRVYEALKDIPGLRVPKTIRFQPKHLNDILDCMQTHGTQYPLILKAAGKHTGQDTLRFENQDELEDGLYGLALDGRSYYLIQFHDTSQEGVFSKFRVVMVDGKVYPRHMRFSDQWMIHYTNAEPFMDQYPEYYTQEKELIENFPKGMPPQFVEVMAEIYRRIPIDYVGMDFTVDPNGDIVLFELNANMLVLITDRPDQAHFVKAVEVIQDAVYQLVKQRIQRISHIQQDSKGRSS